MYFQPFCYVGTVVAGLIGLASGPEGCHALPHSVAAGLLVLKSFFISLLSAKFR